VTPIPVMVLAAGSSSRLGTPKQLLPFRGKPLLAHAVAVAIGCGPVFVVLGSRVDELLLVAEAAGGRAAVNPDWEQGMGSSVRTGLAAVEAALPGAAAVLLTVCDQPHVSAELFGEMVRAFRSGRELVACEYSGTVGVPALFARRYFPELRELAPDAGAKRLLARHAQDVFAVPFPAGVFDIDTPADARLLEYVGGNRAGVTQSHAPPTDDDVNCCQAIAEIDPSNSRWQQKNGCHVAK
jgi:molybdenum cofactor cytidylyltransferase